ncbi:MAG: BTAD domain-containing putative transcriptional regulator [Gemmatimonadota bacterium]|nr:BTAD domain-containing putative transcriptional regulator [Gemmatimonadota bacterium]
MYRLRVLGPLELTRADGSAIGSVLAQPKRAALLAYLAAARPGGFHRRDRLLVLFWPEADQGHARNSLNQSLHMLRRSLGPSVIETRGREEVGLADDALWCDAAELRSLLEAGETEAALGLYRGDLLEGLHLTGTPDFERWLDVERSNLRGLVHGAALERADRTDDPQEIRRWLERAAGLVPTDETVVRRLMKVLDGIGDRGGAIRAYETCARDLALLYDSEPSPETDATLARIQARVSSAAAPEIDEPVLAAMPAATPRVTLPARRAHQPLAKSDRRLAAALTAALGGFSVVALSLAVYVPGWLSSGRGGEREEATFEQITHTGNACSPSISPDGSMLAFYSIEGETAHLHVQDVIHGRALRVSDVPWRGIRCPRPAGWSPDGSRLLVAAPYQVQIVSRFGGNPLNPSPIRGQMATWSPDGTAIATASIDSRGFTVTDLVSGEATRVPLSLPDSHSLDWLSSLEWSGLERRLAALTYRGEVHTLWSVSRTGEMRELVTDTAELSSPRWGPGSASIYYLRAAGDLRDAGVTAELWKVGVGPIGERTSSPELVRTGLQGGDLFTITADGSRMAYTRLSDRWELWVAERDPAGVGETTWRQLLGGTARLWEPAFSPDGEHVSLIRGHPGDPIVLSLADARVREVAPFERATQSPAWSPDGRALAFAVSEGPVGRIWTVRGDGAGRRRYHEAEVTLAAYKTVAWCTASSLIYEEPGHMSLRILDLEDGSTAPLLPPSPEKYVFLPLCSPDGSEFAFYRNGAGTGLYVASLEAPGPHLLAAGTIYPSSWSNDGDWVYAMRIGEDRRGMPVRVARLDGRVEPLLHAPPDFEGEVRWSQTAISRDGVRLVFNHRVSTSDIVLVERFDAARR